MVIHGKRWRGLFMAAAMSLAIIGCGNTTDVNNPSGGIPGMPGTPLPGSGSGGGGSGGGSGSSSFRVTAIDPPDGAVGVQPIDPIVVTFNNPVDPPSVTATSFRVRDGAGSPVTGVISTSGRTARLTPATGSLAKSTQYTVALTTAVKDAAGTALSSDFVSNFTTSSDAWTSTAVTPLTASARADHTAVWTGSEMIVWGGVDNLGLANTGARYDPTRMASDSWVSTSNISAPLPRTDHTAVWTGSEMIVWGGDVGGTLTSTGGRYTPTSGAGAWKATSNNSGLVGRRLHTAVWTGSEMIVWGGDTTIGAINNGAAYRPATDRWARVSLSGAPTPRFAHTAIWTGTEMIVWGGDSGTGLGFANTGGRFRPDTNDWRGVSLIGAPSGRIGHTAVWTGTEMIVWGGTSDGVTALNDGARYDPATNTWHPMQNAPIARTGHEAVWTGTEMIVWGGDNADNSGAAYNPAHDTWRLLTVTNAPSPRSGQTAVWTGTEMIVWGGGDGLAFTSSGGRYTP